MKTLLTSRCINQRGAGHPGSASGSRFHQKLTEEEVYSLYKTVAQSISVPLCVYENPGTTNFHFSDELLIRIALLPATSSIKLSGGYPDKESYLSRIKKLRSALPERVSLGISGDAFAVPALNAGCDTWYSVIGGLFPQTAMNITRQALSRYSDDVNSQSQALEPFWELFRQHGSLRIIAAAAILGLTKKQSSSASYQANGRDDSKDRPYSALSEADLVFLSSAAESKPFRINPE